MTIPWIIQMAVKAAGGAEEYLQLDVRSFRVDQQRSESFQGLAFLACHWWLSDLLEQISGHTNFPRINDISSFPDSRKIVIFFKRGTRHVDGSSFSRKALGGFDGD